MKIAMKKIISFLFFLICSSNLVFSQTPNVPYFYQYNNSINPGGSCQNTSIAMLLKYYGANAITPDAISNTWGTSQAQTVSGFNSVCNSEAQNYGLSATCISTSSGSFSALNGLLAQGKPVAVHGYFTSYGHVMVVLAFTGTEYICNDPAGEWSQQYQNGGYSTTNATEGIQVHYGSTAFLNAIGPDNTLWYHYMNGSVPNLDNVAPTTQVTAPTGWVTQNFATTFTDTDNNGGSGVEKSFYQVLEYTGTEWRANNTRGFFSDNFDTAIHPDWTSATGTWAINGGYLEQSDEANTNTNIYAPLTQNLSNRYLYTWSGKIDGSGTNRRAGFHFFCDSAAQTNRGNSYFVWFRADQSQLQIYKVANNVFGSAAYSVPVTINTGTWYSYSVAYDRISGKMDVYVNNALIGSWTDSAPYSTGNFISFRSGDCNYMVNDLKVYRSRAATATILVGAASTNDVRYQNLNPTTPSCRVKSITKDAAGNLSAVSAQDIDVDWTAPDTVLVNDGLSTDIDTSNSLTQLTANWTASADTHSGITKYWYAIGTTAGGTDIVNWTDNGLVTSVTSTGLSLIANQLYYVSVKVENTAGLVSNEISSDGQLVNNPNSIDEKFMDYNLSLYPNPFNSSALINYTIHESANVEVYLTDMLGKKIVMFSDKQIKGKNTLELDAQRLQLAKGIYVIGIKTNRGEAKLKVVVQ
jgi:hypothetical protein